MGNLAAGYCLAPWLPRCLCKTSLSHRSSRLQQYIFAYKKFIHSFEGTEQGLTHAFKRNTCNIKYFFAGAAGLSPRSEGLPCHPTVHCSLCHFCSCLLLLLPEGLQFRLNAVRLPTKPECLCLNSYSSKAI